MHPKKHPPFVNQRCARKSAAFVLLLTALSCLSASLQAEPLKVFLLAGDEHVLEQALIGPAETTGTLLDVVANDPKYSFLQDDAGEWISRQDVLLYDAHPIHNNTEAPASPVEVGVIGRAGPDAAPAIGVDLMLSHRLGAALGKPLLILRYGVKPQNYLRPGSRNLAHDFRPPSSGGGSDLDGSWDVIHFNFGVWDATYRDPASPYFSGYTTTSVEQFEQNLRTLVARMQQTGATLIWGSVTPVWEGDPATPNGDEEAFNAVAAQVMQENGVIINDLHAEVLRQGAGTSTNVHDVGNLAPITTTAIQGALATLENPTQPLPRVLFIGDSITGTYWEQVKVNLDGQATVFKNPGNAEDTWNGLERIDQWLDLQRYLLNGQEYLELVDGVKKVMGEEAERAVPGYDPAQGMELAGFIWFQGEADSDSDSMAADYETHLANLIRDLRQDFNAPELPVVVAGLAKARAALSTREQQIFDAQMAVSDPVKYPEFAGNVVSIDTRPMCRPIGENPGGRDRYSGNAASYLEIGDAMAEAILTMGETKPLVTLTASEAEADEGGLAPGVWTLTRTGDLADPLTVFFDLGGSATPGVHYTLNASGSVTFPAGAAAVNITLTPVDDAIFNGVLAAEMTLVTVPAYLPWTGAATIHITDNDNQAPIVDAGADQSAAIGENVLWSPDEITTAAWYDASDAATITQAGGKVSEWRDKSGNARHAVQATATRQPNYLSADPMMNDLPSIGHPGRSGLIGLDLPSFTAGRIYAVTYYKDGVDASFDDYSTLFSGPASNGQYRAMGDKSTADFIGTFNFNDAGTYKNGAAESSLNVLPLPASLLVFEASSPRTQIFSIGYNQLASTRDWQGAYSELIFTDGSEDLATRQKIEGYLAYKWGFDENLPADHPEQVAAVVQLNGLVSDLDGGTPAVLWTQISGPTEVRFTDASSAQTSAVLNVAGSYLLRLTADDGFEQTYDEINIVVTDGNSGTDSDGNGFDDSWETEHFGGLGRVVGTEDSDGDGVNDFFEYLYGSDPRDAASRGFQLQAKADNASNGIFFDWTVADQFVLDADYRVEVSTDLSRWDPLPTENYSLQQRSQDGKSRFELILTHNYGNQVFIKLVQAND